MHANVLHIDADAAAAAAAAGDHDDKVADNHVRDDDDGERDGDRNPM